MRTVVSGRSTQRSPFGRGMLSTACGILTWSASDRLSLTNARAAITCPECRKVIEHEGWRIEGLCDDCNRLPAEGHEADCVFVDWYGISLGPKVRGGAA